MAERPFSAVSFGAAWLVGISGELITLMGLAWFAITNLNESHFLLATGYDGIYMLRPIMQDGRRNISPIKPL